MNFHFLLCLKAEACVSLYERWMLDMAARAIEVVEGTNNTGKVAKYTDEVAKKKILNMVQKHQQETSNLTRASNTC